jgi:hypothetical protein
MQQRPRNRHRQHQERQERQPHTGRTRSRRRSFVPEILIIAGVAAGLALGVNALGARAAAPTPPTKTDQHRTAATSTPEASTRPSGEAPEAPDSHVTFGAHQSATQACSTCHPGKQKGEIACRSCHGDTCGKDSKTVADCLACHKTGVTDRWVEDTP